MTTTYDQPLRTPRVSFFAVAAVALLLGTGLYGVATYNRLVALDQQVRAQWAQVENAYQRRLDLVPNLVRTVQGSANFERQTLVAVTEARAHAANTAAPTAPSDPAAFARYQAAQTELGSALSRLLVVVESYPELHSTTAFLDLQAQLEGTENRIAIERMRFNEAAQAYNTRRNGFPAVLLVGFFGPRFRDRSYFTAAAGAANAPAVQF